MLAATWYEARDKCLELGGDLVALQTEAEFGEVNDELMALPVDERADSYWVGLAAHMWTWTNGQWLQVLYEPCMEQVWTKYGRKYGPIRDQVWTKYGSSILNMR